MTEETTLIQIRGLEETVQTGTSLQDFVCSLLIHFPRSNMDVFAWPSKDMKEIDNNITSYKLNIESTYPMVKQKKCNIGPKEQKKKSIEEEVDKLLAAGFIHKVQYLEWFGNIDLVIKLMASGKYISIT